MHAKKFIKIFDDSKQNNSTKCMGIKNTKLIFMYDHLKFY